MLLLPIFVNLLGKMMTLADKLNDGWSNWSRVSRSDRSSFWSATACRRFVIELLTIRRSFNKATAGRRTPKLSTMGTAVAPERKEHHRTCGQKSRGVGRGVAMGFWRFEFEGFLSASLVRDSGR